MQDERERIHENGGIVTNHFGAWRVNGMLNISRAIGKFVVAIHIFLSLRLYHVAKFLKLLLDDINIRTLWEDVYISKNITAKLLHYLGQFTI